jgi:hypothetical protein
MYALPSKADMLITGIEVREVPITDTGQRSDGYLVTHCRYTSLFRNIFDVELTS